MSILFLVLRQDFTAAVAAKTNGKMFLPDVFADPSLDTVVGGLLMTGPWGMLVGNADSG